MEIIRIRTSPVPLAAHDSHRVLLVDLPAPAHAHGQIAIGRVPLPGHLMRLGDLCHQVHGLGCGCLRLDLPVNNQLPQQPLLELEHHGVPLEGIEGPVRSAARDAVGAAVGCNGPNAALPESRVCPGGPLIGKGLCQQVLVVPPLSMAQR